jgi:hypothetical protein
MTPEDFFVEQLKVIKKALCTNCYDMGDFNLDAKMSYRKLLPPKNSTTTSLLKIITYK